MIIEDDLAQVISSGVSGEISFGLGEEGVPIILDILRNKLYSNKEGAIVREYASNSFDSMVQAGKKDQPFSVTIPTNEEPTLKIRDFGYGLTPQEIKDVFVSYGVSTKRGSNDFVGQMGIGCKSGFCYSDSFMVVSYQHGRKKTYNCYIDPTKMGKMALLSDDESTEADGLEIIISVKDEDVYKFQRECTSFFKYWKVKPLFTGYIPQFPKESVVFEGKDGSWLLPSKVENTSRFEYPVAIMGNVAYVMSRSSLDWTGYDNSLETLMSVGVRMFFRIGELSVSASRESLEYTEQTQKAIMDRLVIVRDELISSVNTQFTNCHTMYEAKILFSKIFDLASPLYPLRDLFEKNITFNGKLVTSNFWVNEDSSMGASVKRFTRATGKRTRASSEIAKRIIAEDSKLIIFNDTGSDKGLLGRIAPLVELETNSFGRRFAEVQLISVRDKSLWEVWKTEKFFDAPTILLSSLPKWKMKDVYFSNGVNRSANDYINPKYAAKVFRWKYNDSENNIDYWEECDVDYKSHKGVYVKIDKYQYEGPKFSYCSPKELASIKAQAENFGIDWPEIIGIKRGKIYSDNAPPNMISLWDYLKKSITEKLKTKSYEQEIVDSEAVVNLFCSDYYGENIVSLINDILVELNLPSCPVASHLQEMGGKTRRGEINGLKNLMTKVGIVMPKTGLTPRYDIAADYREFQARYPLLFVIDSYSLVKRWTEIKKHVVAYVSMVNASISNDKNVDIQANKICI